MSGKATLLRVSQTNFRFKVGNISELDTVSSPEFVVQGVPWCIEVQKHDSEEEPLLGIYLKCAENDSTDWSYAAFASFKLLTFDDNKNPIEKNLSPQIFDGEDNAYGFRSLIAWKDLFDANGSYVEDDTAHFDIKFGVADPTDLNRSTIEFECVDKCCERSGSAIFRLKVTNIDNLMAVRSPEFMLLSLPWMLTVLKDQESSSLGVCLDSKSPEDDEEASCRIRMKTTLTSSKNEVDPVVDYAGENVNYGDGDCLCANDVIPWSDLINRQNGFVVDNSITLEIDLKMGKSEGVEDQDAERKKMECVICFDIIGDQDVSCPPCGHLFCSPCIKNHIKKRKTCPTCDAPVTLQDLRRVFLPMVNSSTNLKKNTEALSIPEGAQVTINPICVPYQFKIH